MTRTLQRTDKSLTQNDKSRKKVHLAQSLSGSILLDQIQETFSAIHCPIVSLFTDQVRVPKRPALSIGETGDAVFG